MANNSAVVTKAAPRPSIPDRFSGAKDVQALLERCKAQFALALPKHMSVDRLMRIALTAVQKNPRLMQCTPTSFLSALMTSAQVGLEPDGVLGRAYLIPRNNRRAGTMECNFQPGYLGLLELCQRSGEIASVRAEVVRRGDFLEYEKGLEEKLVHREGDDPDGEITHVYAIIRTKNGGRYWDCWKAARVEKHRQRFSQDTREEAAWNTDWPAMAKKTLLISVSKLAPKSVELARAVVAQEQSEAGLGQTTDLGDFFTSEPVPAADAKPKTVEGLVAKAKEEKAAGAATSAPAQASHPEQPAPAAAPTAGEALAEEEEGPPHPAEEVEILPKTEPKPKAAPKAKAAPPDKVKEMMLSDRVEDVLAGAKQLLGIPAAESVVKQCGGSLGMLNLGLGTDGQKNLIEALRGAVLTAAGR